jgi:hypothetical protein
LNKCSTFPFKSLLHCFHQSVSGMPGRWFSWRFTRQSIPATARGYRQLRTLNTVFFQQPAAFPGNTTPRPIIPPRYRTPLCLSLIPHYFLLCTLYFVLCTLDCICLSLSTQHFALSTIFCLPTQSLVLIAQSCSMEPTHLSNTAPPPVMENERRIWSAAAGFGECGDNATVFHFHQFHRIYRLRRQQNPTTTTTPTTRFILLLVPHTSLLVTVFYLVLSPASSVLSF